MEKRVKIISQSELRTNNWTNNKGENVVISSVQLEMTDGNDAFVAEVTDQKAIAINNEPLSKEAEYAVQLKMVVRSWESEQTHQKGKSTTIKVLNIAKI